MFDHIFPIGVEGLIVEVNLLIESFLAFLISRFNLALHFLNSIILIVVMFLLKAYQRAFLSVLSFSRLEFHQGTQCRAILQEYCGINSFADCRMIFLMLAAS